MPGLFQPATISGILTQGGRRNPKMDGTERGAKHKMTGSEVMYNSDSRSSAYQAKALFNRMPYKINMMFEIFFGIHTINIHTEQAEKPSSGSILQATYALMQ